MTGVFAGSFQLIDDTKLEGGLEPVAYSEWVKQTLTNLKAGNEGILRFRRPQPTAAFSSQDTSHPNYQRAKEQALANGFTPIERGTGGRLSIFDEGALALTLIAPHSNPHEHTMRRYELFAGAIVGAISNLGIDARIGELPNEYCPGKFSINAQGRFKLVGVAQRMNRRGYQMGAIIAIERSDRACSAITDAYRTMALSFDPNTYGAISDLRVGLDYHEICQALVQSIVDELLR